MKPISKIIEFTDVAHSELEHVVKEIKDSTTGNVDITVEGHSHPNHITDASTLDYLNESAYSILRRPNSSTNIDMAWWLHQINKNDVTGSISIATADNDPLSSSMWFRTKYGPQQEQAEPEAPTRTVTVVYVENIYDAGIVKTNAFKYSGLSDDAANDLLSLNGDTFSVNDQHLAACLLWLPRPQKVEQVDLFAGSETAIVHIEVVGEEMSISDHILNQI